MKRLEDLSFAGTPLLTQLALGVSNEAFVSNELMPILPVDTNTGEYPIFPNDAMKISENIERPFQSDDIKMKAMTGFSVGSFKLQEYALGAEIDKDEIEEASARSMLALDKYYMEIIMESMLLAQEKKRVDLLVDSANYASGNSSALVTTDCWDNTASKPLTQIKDAQSTIRSKTGVKANVLALGQTSFDYLSEHASVVDKLKYSQKAIVTEDLISEMISTRDNPIKVVVGAGMYYDRTTSAYVDLWGDVAILAYVPQTPTARRSKYTPSFGYTFTKKGFPYAGEEWGKFNLTKIVAAFMKYQIAVTQNSAGYLFTNTKA